MAINKVLYGSTALIDLTDTTATASDVAQGKYFYTKAGVRTAGTASGGGSGANIKTGTYTPSQTYSSNGNRLITTTSNIGFTPSQFFLYVKNTTSISSTAYAIIQASFQNQGNYYLRLSARYSNSTGSLACNTSLTNWTNQTNGYMYYNDGNIYFRTSSTLILVKDVEYLWRAIE